MKNPSLQKQITSLDTRMDRHLEIYAANGKEMQRMADLIENKVIPALGKVDELYGVLLGAKTLRSAIKWAAIVLITTGSAVTAWKVLAGYFISK